MLQSNGVICVRHLRTVHLKVAFAIVLKSVDIRDVVARNFHIRLKKQSAHHVSQLLEFRNVTVAVF